MTPEASRQLLASADVVCPAADIHAAIDRLAQEITDCLQDEYPLVLPIMGGAVVFAGQLLPKLIFPLEFDYLHATRYGDVTHGGVLTWIKEPPASVAGRSILLLDDILDEGITLAAIRIRLLELGAKKVLIAVMSEKITGHPKPLKADFTGVQLPNRYVFGCGMDVRGAWRNLPDIYALRAETAI